MTPEALAEVKECLADGIPFTPDEVRPLVEEIERAWKENADLRQRIPRELTLAEIQEAQARAVDLREGCG